MGFFSRKKKTSVASPSPATSSSPIMPSPPATPEYLEPVEPPITLSVVLDGWRSGSDTHCFTIQISKDATITALRQSLAAKLGDVSMSLFKVAIPKLAAEQARTYTERYSLPVDLIASFPCYNVDDPEQLAASLGPAGWQLAGLPARQNLVVKDWWPEPAVSDVITLLVRRADGPSTSIPVTFAVHLAQPGSMSRANRPTTPGGGVVRTPPTVIDVASSISVAELKSAILTADSRSTVDSEQLILWRVEMSEEEMIVIEERGGLKNGKMPWPYPPTAPVPSGLTDSSLPISHYFPSFTSNTRIITLSAYIPSSVPSMHKRSIPSEAETAPAFRYPMIFPSDWSPAPSSTFTLQAPPLPRSTTRQSPNLGSAPKVSPQGRQRPSTAPVNGSGAPSFGGRRMAVRPAIPSPLIESTTPTGLGINTTPRLGSPLLDEHRGSTSSNMSSMSGLESDDSMTPSLDFSVLSLDSNSPTSTVGTSRSALNTPVSEKSEWMPVGQGLLPSTAGLTVPKGLERAVSMQRVTKWGRVAGKIYQ